jgi:hypothetical protein
VTSITAPPGQKVIWSAAWNTWAEGSSVFAG